MDLLKQLAFIDFKLMYEIVFHKIKFIPTIAPILLDSDNLVKLKNNRNDQVEVVKALFSFLNFVTCEPQEYASQKSFEKTEEEMYSWVEHKDKKLVKEIVNKIFA